MRPGYHRRVKIFFLLLAFSFFPLSNLQAKLDPICSLDKDVKSLVLKRIFNYLYFNTDQDFDEAGKNEGSSCPIFLFEQKNQKPIKISSLDDRKTRFVCALPLEKNDFLLKICLKPQSQWQKIECSQAKWSKVYPANSRDICFEHEEQRLIIFSDGNPFYFKQYWSETVRSLSKEFKIHPMGLLLYNEKTYLIYF